MPWRSGTITVTDVSPARRRVATGLRRSPEGIPPTAGCGIGTETGWSANDGRWVLILRRCLISGWPISSHRLTDPGRVLDRLLPPRAGKGAASPGGVGLIPRLGFHRQALTSAAQTGLSASTLSQ